MRRMLPILTTLVLLFISSGVVTATPLKTHVEPFNVTGAPDSENLKQTFQGILTSRLNPDMVKLVEKPDQAELLIIGSYAQFGKMFSLDVLLKNRENGSLTKVFEQGEGQEDVIPALGRLARKIDAELVKMPVPATPPTPSPASAQMAVKDQYIIKTETPAKASPDSWSSAPLDGIFSSIATGRTNSSGERELFIAGTQTIRAYLKGSELRLVAETSIPPSGKILAIDTADLDKDGSLELYATIIDRESLSSRVYKFDGTAFVMIAEKLPWFFRGIGNDVVSRKIYAQKLKDGSEYYGEVKELLKSNTIYTAGTPIKLPRSGNIFNFNRLAGATGKDGFVVLDQYGYLAIYAPDGSEIWKSSEKYGGSESFFSSKSHAGSRSTSDLDRWTFLQQRIMLLKDGTIIVPRNEGSLNFGNIRSFDKHALFAFEWNGTALNEKWHTRQSPGYLADYALDPTSGEVLLLKVVKKPGLFTGGKSVISINKIN
ncbi:MAG: VCBS repeat-containing protein [Desulfuromonadaceae bacterium]|nr:VCBS repeat-containing protein [Desulfuromonadaceae bacterium]